MAERPNELRNLNRRLVRAGNARANRRQHLEELRDRVERLREARCASSSSDSNRSRSSSSSSISSSNSVRRSRSESDNDLTQPENNSHHSDENEFIYLSSDTNQSDNSDSSRSWQSSDNEIDPNDFNENRLFQNEADKERFLIFALRQWALEGGVLSMSKLDSLLAVLNMIFPNVPKSYKTLLETPLNTEIVREDNGGLMWYKGIRCNLENMLLEEYLLKYGQIAIDINMDGLPLSKNSCKKFWPILGKLVNTLNQPFKIAIYQCTEDPQNVYYYLDELVRELQDLSHNGFNYRDTTYPFVVRDFILDRPARKLVKCCVAHGAYGACEKCEVYGEYLDDRMVYLDLNAPLRTDDSYLNQTDPVHHLGRSPLEAAGIKMVSQFRLDSFHLVYHGVVRRLLEVYNTWPGEWRFTIETRNQISEKLTSLIPTCPQDFNRKPRPMKFWRQYHGTEERRLCIYDGMLVFKDNLPDEVYKNFLLLQSAIYILASPVLVLTMVQNAKELLRTFIEHSTALFGRKFVVLNVHSLVHLGDECEERGPLENFSAFPFENTLKSIKEMLQTGGREIQQAGRRDQERTKEVPILLHAEPEIRLSNEHIDPIETFPGLQYRKISIDREVVFAVGDGDAERDSCFKTKGGDVHVLQNILRNEGNISLIGRKFQRSGNFYEYPLPSSDLGILSVTDLGQERIAIDLQDFMVVQNQEDGAFHLALSKWIVSMDQEKKTARILLPDDGSSDFFVKQNMDAADDWVETLVDVKRYKSQYNEAKQTLKKFQKFPDYDTGSDKALGRGKRFRRSKRMTDSETESPHPMKKGKLAPPPPVSLTKVSAKATTSSVSRNVVVQSRGMNSQTKMAKLLSESKSAGKPEAPEVARLEKLEQRKQKILLDREKKSKENEELRKDAPEVARLEKLEQRKQKMLLGKEKRSKENEELRKDAPEVAKLEKLEQRKQKILLDREKKSKENEELRKDTLNLLSRRKPANPLVKSNPKLESTVPTKNVPKRNVSICVSDRKKDASDINLEKSQSDLVKSSTQRGLPKSVSGSTKDSSVTNLEKSQTVNDLVQSNTIVQSLPTTSTSNTNTILLEGRVSEQNLSFSKQNNDSGLSTPLEKTSEATVQYKDFTENPVYKEFQDFVKRLKSNSKNKSNAAEGKAPSCPGLETHSGSVDNLDVPKTVQSCETLDLNALSNDSGFHGHSSVWGDANSEEEVGVPTTIYDADTAVDSLVSDGTDHEHSDLEQELIGTDDEDKNSYESADGSGPDSDHSENSGPHSPVRELTNADSRAIRRVEAAQEIMNTKLDLIISNQGRVNRALTPMSKRLQKPPWVSVPLTTPEKFNAFEKYLKDDDKFDAFTYFIEAMGIPDDEKKAASKLMPKMLSNWMGSKFSFDGQGTKAGFKDTKLWDAIETAMYMKYGTDLSQFISDVRQWLRNAKGRKGGKTAP